MPVFAKTIRIVFFLLLTTAPVFPGFVGPAMGVPYLRGVDVDPATIDGGQTINIIAEVRDTGDGIGLVCADLRPLGGPEKAVMRDDGDPRSGDRFPGDGVYGLLWRVPENWMPGSTPLELRAYEANLYKHASGRVQVSVRPEDIIVDVADAPGDDHGPNQPGKPGLYYTYPQAEVFAPGIFDIRRLRIDRVLANVDGCVLERLAFCVDMAWFPELGQPGNPDWNPFFGDLSLAKVDLLIDAAPGGTVSSLPGRRAAFQPWDAWEYAIVMDGWTKAVIPSGGSESVAVWRTNALQDDASIVLLSDHCGSAVSALVDPAALGSPSDEEIRLWDVIVQVSSHVAGEDDVFGSVRRVDDIASEWRFGGGDLHERDAHLLDVLLVPGKGKPEGRPQEYLLDYTSDEAFARLLAGRTPVVLEVTAGEVSRVPESPGKGVVLFPNVPNPFNPETEIAFLTTERTRVSLRVYDVSGRMVTTLLEQTRVFPGRHRSAWDGTDDRGRGVASGTYFCVLEAEGVRESVRMALVR